MTNNPSEGVNIPPGSAGTPTGIVFNGGGGFNVSETVNGVTTTGSSVFIFATEDGTIAGWAPNVDFNNAIMAVNNSPGAVYKGLAIGTTNNGTFIYAANFRAGTVDVFDTNFNLVQSFTDPNAPAGYAPFGIQNINGTLYVTFAVQNAAKHDDVGGQGHGLIDKFDLNGNLITRLVQHGQLNSPWGLALAPAGFGDFSGDLIVGNFGNGHINAYDPNNGTFIDKMRTPSGQAIVIDDLWGLSFGNDHAAGPSTSLFFTAGINDEADGLFGNITVNSGSSSSGAAAFASTVSSTSAAIHSATTTVTASQTQHAAAAHELSNVVVSGNSAVSGISQTLTTGLHRAAVKAAIDAAFLNFELKQPF